MLRQSKFIFYIVCALLISACGGGDNAFTESSGGDTGGNGGTDTTGTETVASLTLVTSNIQLPSDGSDSVTITATVKDAGNALLASVPVSFSATSGDLTVTQGTTDDSGQAIATISAGNDPANRTITVTATSGDASDSLDVNVFGTQLTIDGPSSLVFGATGEWTVQLKDSGGDGIADELVTVTSALGNAIALEAPETDTNGQVSVKMTATVGGTDTLTVSALGMSVTAEVTISSDEFNFTVPTLGDEIPLDTNQVVTVRWRKAGIPQANKTINFSTTRGGSILTDAVSGKKCILSLPPALTNENGEATVEICADNAGFAVINAAANGGTPQATREIEFVATLANSIDLQADPSSIGPNESSTITAVVRDPENNLVKNKVIEFNLRDVTGGNLSVPQAITDSQGKASTVYTATDATSAKDGVQVTATVRDTPTVNKDVRLTVANKPLRITMNTGSELEVRNNVQYNQPWAIQVTDANGNPAPAGTSVAISVLPTGYIKGNYVPSRVNDTDVAPWVRDNSIICPNEDGNLNGVLDPDLNEDRNNNGVLDIPNPATVVPNSGSSFVTDTEGSLLFGVLYPKGNGTWSGVELKATVEVEGTETSISETYVLPVLADDVDDLKISPPGGRPSPYGTERPTGTIADCEVGGGG